MPRATCRCGQTLDVPDSGSGRAVCPKCGARVKLRGSGTGTGAGAGAGIETVVGSTDDGYIRFACPCGRRLKVDAANPPSHGKCPDCGEVVPVPAASTAAGTARPSHPETPTEDLSPADRATLEAWTSRHLGRAAPTAAMPPSTTTGVVAGPPPPEADRAEVGLRVCPNCGRPVHLGAEACRSCGTSVPRR